MRRSTLLTTLVRAIAVVAASCYDGPVAHRNPNDPATLFIMRLEADKDTISPGDPAVQYTLITEPAFPGYAPLWSVSIDALVYHTQNGRFLVTDVPESVITVQIGARFMNQSVSRALVIRPTP